MRDALAEVIDPDLGVNIVDLGFVRDVALDGRTAVITMTLTSAACPLTGVLEDQIRAGLVPLGCVDDFRVDWQWIPAGGPPTSPTAAASSCAPSASPSDPGPQSRSPALTGAAMVFPGGASGHCHASLYRQDG